MIRSNRKNRQGSSPLIAALVFAVMAMTALSAHGLPPEHEVQRLMLAVEDAVAGERWSEAGDYLNRLQSLEAAKPPEYLYYRGRIMSQSGHYNEARSALENYIAGTGADGEHYTEALKLITRIEQARGDRDRSTETGSEPVAEISPAGPHSPERLRRLYLADSDSQALVMHLNSQLELAGWRKEARVIRVGEPADVRYQLSVANGDILIRESRVESGTDRRLISHTLRVYGVSPSVRWDCESATNACWIYDPRDGSRFLQLANDRAIAAEVASTLGQLIRELQRPSGNS